MTKYEIGKRIKARREYLGMTQSEVGEALGVTGNAVTQYEKGTRELKGSELGRLAEILTVPIAYFYGDDDMDGPIINSYYEGLPPSDRKMADDIIKALWLKHQREDTTHGKKAE